LQPQKDDTTHYNYAWYNARNELIQLHNSTDGDSLFNIASGDYQVQVQGSSGCEAAYSFKATLAPRVQFTSQKDTGCTGDRFSFKALYSEEVRGYYWELGNGDTSGLPDPSTTFLQPGDYIVRHRATSMYGCESETVTRSIKIHQTPAISAGEDQTIIAGNSAILLGVRNNASVGVQWSPIAYLSNDISIHPVARPPASVSYVLSATGDGGCKSSDIVTITVLEKLVIPNAFSPNNDGINDKWSIPGLSSYERAKVLVFNRWGQVVYQSDGYNLTWDGRMKGKDLPIGTYYYVIDLNEENIKNAFRGPLTILR
jgi:gliding motility-associated-like protein